MSWLQGVSLRMRISSATGSVPKQSSPGPFQRPASSQAQQIEKAEEQPLQLSNRGRPKKAAKTAECLAIPDDKSIVSSSVCFWLSS